MRWVRRYWLTQQGESNHVGDSEQRAASNVQSLARSNTKLRLCFVRPHQCYVPLSLPRAIRDAWFDLGEKCLGVVALSSRLQKHINMADTRKFQTAYINLLCISCTIASCALDLSTSISSGFDEPIPILGRVVFGFETRD